MGMFTTYPSHSPRTHECRKSEARASTVGTGAKSLRVQTSSPPPDFPLPILERHTILNLSAPAAWTETCVPIPHSIAEANIFPHWALSCIPSVRSNLLITRHLICPLLASCGHSRAFTHFVPESHHRRDLQLRSRVAATSHIARLSGTRLGVSHAAGAWGLVLPFSGEAREGGIGATSPFLASCNSGSKKHRP